MNDHAQRTSGKREYRLKQRARAQAETRRRILEATMALHEEVGPRRTTISAIAARAGVQRLTVYRHFPDETAVFQACTSHWLALNPPPGPEDWAEVPDREAGRRAAIAAFTEYYGCTRAMWSAAHRDLGEVPALQASMEAFAGYLDGLAAELGADLGPLARATLRHLLGFPGWQALDALGVGQDRKLCLAEVWLAGARRSDAES